MVNASRGREQQRKGMNSGLIWYKGILVAGLGLAIIGVVAFLILGGIMGGEKAKLKEYLDNKYGQEFVVENVYVRGAGLGVDGAWTAEAYPKSDPSTTFQVDRSQTTGEISVDTFLQVLWTKQGAGEVKTFLANKVPSNEGYFLEIKPGSPGNILYDSIQGDTPSLSKILKKDKDKVVYTLSVRNAAATNSEEPSSTQLENALKVVKFVKGKGIDISSVRYTYRDYSFTEKNRTGEQQYQYSIHVEPDELESITTSADLKKYFETIN